MVNHVSPLMHFYYLDDSNLTPFLYFIGIQLIRLILTHMLEFPPGVMDALASSKKFWADLGPSADTTIFVTIYDLVC